MGGPYLLGTSGQQGQPYLSDTYTWTPLRFLTFYRAVLAGVLLVLFFAVPEHGPFGEYLPRYFALTASFYFAFAIVAGFAARLRRPAYRWQSLVQILVDILAITVMMHTSGGLGSGLGILLVVAVAAGSLLVPGRVAFLFAAIATLSVLGEYGYGLLTLPAFSRGTVTQAGLMGLAFFATAALAGMLAIRLRESEALAEQRGVDLANLEQLNERIIQRLQSGILVVDPRDRVKLMNRTAWTQLGRPEDPQGRRLGELLPELQTQLSTWRRNPDWTPPTVHPEGSELRLIPKFTPLGTAANAAVIVSLDDSAALAQQAQQLKLASLGRLTASIAHEIRNPLGAISHAAQLLGESEELNPGDHRLTEIIRNHTLRVNTIIENVLQLSRRRTAQPQRIGLQDWLSEFVDEFTASLGDTETRVRSQVSPPELGIAADPSHLHQILWNLCQNALQHSAAGEAPARVEIRGGHNAERGRPYLEVIDNGPGIPADQAEEIFEPFFTTAQTGTGLGLYLAKELCESNQATLSYHDAPSGGSCFHIEFPATALLPAETGEATTEQTLRQSG
jgi:two-component system sensor histidine kinase PilS (NtrC family)